MSNLLISRNKDLSALVEAGYRVKIRGAYLIVEGIPYVAENGEIKKADIVTNLELSGEETEQVTIPPRSHTVWWTGGMPHTADGESMESHLSHRKWSEGRDIGAGITVYMVWSRKPKEGGKKRRYIDYREKIETYVLEVSGPAEAKQPGCLKAARLGWDPEVDSHSRFVYMDTNPYRNGTKGIEKRIEEEVVAVIGVGGSGSYLVDILVKTNIKELHLYDDDVMEVHNAFRVAGAARVGELGCGKSKVDWHAERYKEVRKEGLYVHHMKIDDEGLEGLKACTTVFIAVDNLKSRRTIQKACSEMGVLHVSVGIGLEIEGENNDQIGGNVKVETDYHAGRYVDTEDAHVVKPDEEKEDDGIAAVYGSNIQTAELNMLGAALAITEWKAKRGIYRDERDKGIDSIIYSSTTGKILVAQKGNCLPKF